MHTHATTQVEHVGQQLMGAIVAACVMHHTVLLAGVLAKNNVTQGPRTVCTPSSMPASGAVAAEVLFWYQLWYVQLHRHAMHCMHADHGGRRTC
jgi:hypothetical protein